VIHLLAKGGLEPVELGRHVHILGSLPGKHEDYRPVLRFLKPARDAIGIQRSQQKGGLVNRLCYQDPPMAEPLAPDAQRVSHVRQTSLRMLLKVLNQVGTRAVQRRATLAEHISAGLDSPDGSIGEPPPG
jgi:hypothetical protein